MISTDRLPRDAESTKALGCLEKVLVSPPFVQSERLRRFLAFIVTETLAGHADRLKGYTIGVEVFDRDETFDPAIDAIVRVEATRLRAKLREYYDAEGCNDPVRFELPKGSYSVHVDYGRTETSSASSALSQAAIHRAATAHPPLIEDKPSLAVLPFANLSGDATQEYFADGIAESLITELSRLPGLFVISRQSSFAYKSAGKRRRRSPRSWGSGICSRGAYSARAPAYGSRRSSSMRRPVHTSGRLAATKRSRTSSRCRIKSYSKSLRCCASGSPTAVPRAPVMKGRVVSKRTIACCEASSDFGYTASSPWRKPGPILRARWSLIPLTPPHTRGWRER